MCCLKKIDKKNNACIFIEKIVKEKLKLNNPIK